MRKKVFMNVESTKGANTPFTRIYEVCGLTTDGQIVVHSRSLHEHTAYRSMAYILDNFPDLYISMYVRPQLLWLDE